MKKYRPLLILTILLISVAIGLKSDLRLIPLANHLNTHDVTTSKVVKIIDGDTIEIESGEHVRYIGIDTPEIAHNNNRAECFAIEAMDKNSQILLGKQIRLIKDKSDKDRFGRLLRYVYVEDSLVNLVLVEEGYARAKEYPPDTSMSAVLNAAEKRAIRQKLGMWNNCS